MAAGGGSASERGVSMQRCLSRRVSGAFELRARRLNARFEKAGREDGPLLGLRRSCWVTTVKFGTQKCAFHKIQA